MRRFVFHLSYLISSVLFVFLIHVAITNSMDEDDEAVPPVRVVAPLLPELNIQAPLDDCRTWVSSFQFEDFPQYNPAQWHFQAAKALNSLGKRVQRVSGIPKTTNTAFARLDFIFDDGTVTHHILPYIFLSGSASQASALSRLHSHFPEELFSQASSAQAGKKFAGAAAAAAAAAAAPMDEDDDLEDSDDDLEDADDDGLGGVSGSGGVASAEGDEDDSGEVSDSAVGSHPFRSLIDYWPPPGGNKVGYTYDDYRAGLKEELFQRPITDLLEKHRERMGKLMDTPHAHQQYLHSEPTILSYLSRGGELNTILDKLTAGQKGKTLRAVVLNISSFLDICPFCADTLFYNSALRGTFMRNIIGGLEGRGVVVDPRVKLINLVSSVKLHPEGGKKLGSRASQKTHRYKVPLFLDRLPSWVLQMSLNDLRKLF